MSLEVNIEKRLGNFSLKSEFVCEGEATALLGASGCGKSMTLRCIAGIVTPDKGRIVLNGKVLFDSEKNINLPPQKRKVGYLFQNYALFQNMTVEQNIACGIHEEKNKAVRKQAVADMIEKMQLAGMEKRKPFQLSGGQQQRVALARILVGNPEILLLDEPFSALDSHLKDQLLLEVKHLLGSFGKDVMMVTHSRDEAYTMCSRLMIMDQGSLCRVGKTKEVFADPRAIAAAIITGCKNIYPARKVGNTTVEVPELGVVFETGQEVGDDLKAIGIRAHYFNSRTNVNRFPVVFDEEEESPFEWTIKFRYQTQKPNTQSVWWRLGKDKKPQQFPEYLGIAPTNILLLYS
ncbi:MAG: sulfate/molybdate ABC transporter ATP-binding protein [Brotaphodocola sp.]